MELLARQVPMVPLVPLVPLVRGVQRAPWDLRALLGPQGPRVLRGLWAWEVLRGPRVRVEARAAAVRLELMVRQAGREQLGARGLAVQPAVQGQQERLVPQVVMARTEDQARPGTRVHRIPVPTKLVAQELEAERVLAEATVRQGIKASTVTREAKGVPVSSVAWVRLVMRELLAALGLLVRSVGLVAQVCRGWSAARAAPAGTAPTEEQGPLVRPVELVGLVMQALRVAPG